MEGKTTGEDGTATLSFSEPGTYYVTANDSVLDHLMYGKQPQKQLYSHLQNKLTPTLKLNTTKFTLKVKQSTSKVRVTGLASGDSVKSWTSSNKNVAAVNSKGVITAKKKGTAVITVKSGTKKVTCKVTVK